MDGADAGLVEFQVPPEQGAEGANPFGDTDMANLAQQTVASPEQWRLVSHASGIDVAFNRATSHLTLLKPGETAALIREFQCQKGAV
jgi:hypothetical protein